MMYDKIVDYESMIDKIDVENYEIHRAEEEEERIMSLLTSDVERQWEDAKQRRNEEIGNGTLCI